MAKYSYKFKQKVVKGYLSGESGYKCLAERNAISNKCILQNWVKAYREFGDEGLMRSRKNKSYTFEFKMSVVE